MAKVKQVTRKESVGYTQFLVFNSKAIVIVLIIIALGVLGFYNKHWFVAAIVNGSPITNFELLSKMNDQYRQQTLTQLINQKLIANEIKKNAIVVSDSDIDSKIGQLENEFGGKESLDNLLSSQRQTRDDLKRELKLQLAIEKLYAKETTVSAEELDKFLLENANQLFATEAAARRKEGEERLRQKKLSEIFSEKFRELKEKATISIF